MSDEQETERGRADQPDLTVVDLHRVAGPLVIQSIDGEVWHFPDGRPGPLPVEVGGAVEIGDTLALSAGARVLLGTLTLSGGRRGRAHALVPTDAFKAAPRRADVPRLLEQLAGIEAEAIKLGEDPLAMQRGPETAHEKARAAEFAQLNLTREIATELPEAVAREYRAVALFVSDDTAFVAVSSLDVSKLRRLMTELRRPVNPHMVEDSVIDALLMRVYADSPN